MCGGATTILSNCHCRTISISILLLFAHTIYPSNARQFRLEAERERTKYIVAFHLHKQNKTLRSNNLIHCVDVVCVCVSERIEKVKVIKHSCFDAESRNTSHNHLHNRTMQKFSTENPLRWTTARRLPLYITATFDDSARHSVCTSVHGANTHTHQHRNSKLLP